MKKTNKSAALAFARGTKRKAWRPPCEICDNPEMKEFVDVVVREKAAGRSNVSWAQLWEHLKEEFGYSKSKESMRNHVLRHCPDLAKLLKERRSVSKN